MPLPHNPLEGQRPELTLNLNTGSEEQISIIIVHKDRPEYLNICLQSIAVTSMNNNYEIIVVDNNSGPESQDYLNDIANEVKVVRNNKNFYWSKAANRGAEAADKNSKYLVFMHCDVVITNPAWLDLLINVIETSKSGLVGIDLQSYFLQNQKIDYVQEWTMMVTKECWRKIGPFDERLPLIGAPFILSLKAQQAGYKPQILRNPVAHHYKIFSIDINEYEREAETAMSTVAQVMRELQSQSLI